MADLEYDTVYLDLGNGRQRFAEGDAVVVLAISSADALRPPIGILSESVPTATFTDGKPS